jgi:aerobic carbon-monoxide dehydrogenase medium subunit
LIPAEFAYAAPRSLDEAARLLDQNAGAKLLAGGMSLIPALKHRLATPGLVVDLVHVPGLGAIEEKGGQVRIGARATHAEVAASPALRAHPVFAETAAVIGDVQVRNRGTFGGSLAHADPAADWPAVFLALEGEATLVGPKGTRTVKASDFFTGMLSTALRHGEILTGVALRAERGGAAYTKLRQQASGFAIAGVAARVVCDKQGRIEHAVLGVTGINAVPFRAASVEARLRGQAPDAAALRRLCAAVEEADPTEDIHASAEYRRHLAGVFAARSVAQALARAKA